MLFHPVENFSYCLHSMDRQHSSSCVAAEVQNMGEHLSLTRKRLSVRRTRVQPDFAHVSRLRKIPLEECEFPMPRSNELRM
jgi:hypothetical protein